MSEAVIVLTCFNRCEKTVNCIKKLHLGNKDNKYNFVVVDDKSTDDTVGEIKKLGYDDVEILEGTGSLFWNGGMHRGIAYAMEKYSNKDYIILVNDDVDFKEGIIDKMLVYHKAHDTGNKGNVIIGATCSTEGKFSYGGILYTNGINYESIGPDKPDVRCTTFNANCAVIPMSTMKKVGNIDSYYKHSMGDFDLGFKVSRQGIDINVYKEYVGVCNDNPKEGSWQDTSLGIIKRIKLKESFKGLPFKDWFHYLNKNFGFMTACVRSVTPYIKICITSLKK